MKADKLVEKKEYRVVTKHGIIPMVYMGFENVCHWFYNKSRDIMISKEENPATQRIMGVMPEKLKDF